MENYEELSKEQLDALQEVGNIGIGNAASALADLLKAKIDISIPNLGVVPFEKAIESIGNIEDSAIGIQLCLSGDATGIILFLFNRESALQLSNRIISVTFGLEEESKSEEFDQMTQSAIQEIGNILTGNFVNALSQITGLNIFTSPPDFADDMIGAIVSTSLIASEQIQDKVFVFETQFFQEHDAIKGHFLLLPNPGTLDKILDQLGL